MKGLPEVALPREDFVLDAGFDAMPLVQFGGADVLRFSPLALCFLLRDPVVQQFIPLVPMDS